MERCSRSWWQRLPAPCRRTRSSSPGTCNDSASCRVTRTRRWRAEPSGRSARRAPSTSPRRRSARTSPARSLGRYIAARVVDPSATRTYATNALVLLVEFGDAAWPEGDSSGHVLAGPEHGSIPAPVPGRQLHLLAGRLHADALPADAVRQLLPHLRRERRSPRHQRRHHAQLLPGAVARRLHGRRRHRRLGQGRPAGVVVRRRRRRDGRPHRTRVAGRPRRDRQVHRRQPRDSTGPSTTRRTPGASPAAASASRTATSTTSS